MTNNLHEFVPPFTLYLNVENVPNPARKHFEKTNIYYILCSMCDNIVMILVIVLQELYQQYWWVISESDHCLHLSPHHTLMCTQHKHNVPITQTMSMMSL